MKILVTGAAGFIGMHTCLRLLARGDDVIGIDNVNDYYAVSLKEARLAHLAEQAAAGGAGRFRFQRLDVADRAGLDALFAAERPERVVHLAAQAGVRYSLENPHAYVDSNLVGFVNMLECCRHHPVSHLVYASSSSVYGGNSRTPFRESDGVDHPVSLYAATKKANELMAHTYSHLYGLPTTGLRFFTVYGPWGRPDMSPIKFARAIVNGEEMDVYNHGNMLRDFTYVDDVVSGTINALDRPPEANPAYDTANPTPAESWAPYRVFNIGNSDPVKLMDFIATMEQAFGREAKKRFLPMQDGDVLATYADTTFLNQVTGVVPATPLATGLARFAEWYRAYYGVAQG